MTVRPNLLPLLHILQEQNNKRYSFAEIGRGLGISREAANNLFFGEPGDSGYMKYGTMAALLDFFEAEGMPITIGDLFSVTRTG